MMSRAEPVRMCLGCGGRASQAELLRLGMATDDALTVVSRRRHSGRTGYLHRQQACWDRFAARKGPVRSLGRSIDAKLRATFLQQLKQLEQSGMMR